LSNQNNLIPKQKKIKNKQPQPTQKLSLPAIGCLRRSSWGRFKD